MNIPFRRFLKLLIKEAQKKSDKAQRDFLVFTNLARYGLYVANFAELNNAVYHAPHPYKSGSVLSRIGRAALKRGMAVNLRELIEAPNPSEVSFFKPFVLKTETEQILWKIWPAKRAERKIGV